MTEQRKATLTERFLDGTLGPAERKELTEALHADPEFSAELSFLAKLDGALQEERFAGLDQRQRRENKLNNKKIAGLVLILLILVGALGYWLYSRTPAHPFTPREGYELMDGVVAAAIAEEDLGVVAGTNWRNDLVAGPRVRSKYQEALRTIRQQLDQRGYCQDLQLDYYAGLLELYVNRDYDKAAPLLDCVAGSSSPRYADNIKLPMILLRLGQGRVEESSSLLRSSGLPENALPAAAAERLN